MTTIFERVETALGQITSVPHAMDRMLTASGAALPDKFMVYSVITSTPESHYEDAEAARDYTVQVSIYSRAGLVSLPDVDAVMVAAGFTKGNFRQIPRDAQSGHYGLAKDYHYYEELL